jgi:hypothetical protein
MFSSRVLSDAKQCFAALYSEASHQSGANFLLREAASKALQQAAAGALKGNHQGHASGQMMTPRKIFLAVAELELVAANLRSGRIAHGLIASPIKRL